MHEANPNEPFEQPSQTGQVVAEQPFPTPNNPPWNSGVAVGVWVASVLFILIVPALFLVPYLLSHTQDPAQMVDFAKSDPTAIVLQIASILPAHLLTVALAWLVATQFRKYSLRETIGLDKSGFRWWHYLAIMVGFFIVAATVGYFLPEQDNELLRILRSSRSAVFIVAFVATFTAPIAEEIVYRGILYSAFQRTFGVKVAFVLVTLLFAIVHVPQYFPSYSTIFLLTLLSVILTLIRVRSDNLLPCIILHTVFNGLQSFLLIVEPYLQAPEQAAPGIFN